jgi:outer membrane protein OmpA-like peptidoglycan-associated protein
LTDWSLADASVKTRKQEDQRRLGLHLAPDGEKAIAALPGSAEGALPEALAAMPEVALKTLYINLSELIRHLPGRDDAFASVPLADIARKSEMRPGQNFAKGATRIDPAGQDKLRIHAARLKENPAQVVTLAGYTDDLGSGSYNLAIADQRIEAVAKLLRTYGVPKKQIHPLRRYSVERAGSMAACRSKTTDCRQKIRRVELIYGNR